MVIACVFALLFICLVVCGYTFVIVCCDECLVLSCLICLVFVYKFFLGLYDLFFGIF